MENKGLTITVIQCPRCDSRDLNFKKGVFECKLCSARFAITEESKEDAKQTSYS